MKQGLCVALSIAGCLASGCGDSATGLDPSTERDKVIYDRDDRLDWYAQPDARWREIMDRSIVALIPNANIDASNPIGVELRAPTLREDNVCDNQRFVDQITAADCSGALIGPDLVLTAGHCVYDQRECSDYRFVFNYYQTGPRERANITANDVYGCGELLVTADRTTARGQLDYAIIRLDRPVTPDKRPLPLRLKDNALSTGTPITVIGSPTGLPLKIAGGAEVLNGRPSVLDYFETNLDAFSGNSGSAVLTQDGVLAGVLVRGDAEDYRYDSRLDCHVANVVTARAESDEDVTYVARALEDLCSRFPNEAICGLRPPDPIGGGGGADGGVPDAGVTDGGVPDAGTGSGDASVPDGGAGPDPMLSGLPARCWPNTTPEMMFDVFLMPEGPINTGRPIPTTFVTTRPFQIEGTAALSYQVHSGVPIRATGVAITPMGDWDVTCTFEDGPLSEPPNSPTRVTLLDESGLAAAQDTALVRTVEVPSNAVSLRVAIAGPNGDADLFVRYAAPPTLEEFDCSPFKEGSVEECFFANPPAGTWHIMINAYEAYSDLSLVVEIETEDVLVVGPGNPGASGDAFHMECSIDGLDGLIVGVTIPEEEGQQSTVTASLDGPWGLQLSASFSFDFSAKIPTLAQGILTTALGALGVNCAIDQWPASYTSGDGPVLGEEPQDRLLSELAVSGGSGSEQWWTIEVGADATGIVVEASGGIGDADLYVKFGNKPTVGDHLEHDADCASFGYGEERCEITDPQPGTWYVMLRGAAAFSGVEVQAWVVAEF